MWQRDRKLIIWHDMYFYADKAQKLKLFMQQLLNRKLENKDLKKKKEIK
jgi:hypothetical protein